MKRLITEQQFLLAQPNYPKKTVTDPYYYNLANKLADIVYSHGLLKDYDEAIIARLALALTGYLQDVITDSGIWRSFIESHNALYGRYLPFYDLPDSYIPHELNLEDVSFLTWYVLAMNSEGEKRMRYPLDPELLKAASALHAVLDEVYDDEDAPVPEDFHFWKELELGNPQEADEMFRFGHWLFMHCYLMTPAYAMTLAGIISDPEVRNDMEKLKNALEESMMEDPTGPMALYLREWLFLIFENHMPAESDIRDEKKEEHPWYTSFVRATGGIPIKFFRHYDEMNRFFIDSLGWDEGENLPGLKGKSDFVLLVNPRKGLLVAADVARCIRMEGNPCYEPEYARIHAIYLLTECGLCPGDLLKYLFEHDALPDARFPHTADVTVVHENRDFIARCYLQKYYRGD